MLSKIQLHNKERYFDSCAKSIQYNSVPYGIYAIVVKQQQIYLLSIYKYFPSVKKHVASQCVSGMSDVRWDDPLNPGPLGSFIIYNDPPREAMGGFKENSQNPDRDNFERL